MTEAVVVREPPDLANLPRQTRRTFIHSPTTLADGSSLEIPVTVLAGQRDRPRVLAIAGVHGDEMEGIIATQEVGTTLDPASLAGTLVLISVANPPAFRAAQRRSSLDELDLNRTFPGDRAGTPTQQLAYHLLNDYVLHMDFVLSLHSWGSRGLVVPYVEFPGGEGEVVRRSFAAALRLGLSFLRISQWHPGLLVSCAIQGGVPAVETEIGGLGISQDSNWQKNVSVLRNLLQHLGLVPGGAPPTRDAKVVRHLELSAPIGGLLRQTREIGEPVSRDENIATVRDLHGRVMAEVRSPVDGWVAAYRLCNSVNPGDRIATLFEEIDYPQYRKEM